MILKIKNNLFNNKLYTAINLMPPVRRYCYQFILLLCAYFLLAELGLWLAEPPFYIAPIWPAAGIAVWGLALWGRRLWPAIFLGAFSSGLAHKLISVGWELSLSTVILIAIIAAGSTLQALLSAYWLRDMAPSQQVLNQERHALLKVFYAGPVACMVSATIGVGSIYLFRDGSFEQLLGYWINWWAIDSISVLLMIPFLLFFMVATRKWHNYFWRTFLLHVMVGLVIAAALAFLVIAEEVQKKREIEGSSELFQEVLGRYLTEQGMAVYTLADYFAANINVEPQEFERFTKRIINEGRVRGLAWAPQLSKQNRPARQDKYAINPVEKGDDSCYLPTIDRADYYPVVFVAVAKGPTQTVGLDLSSNRMGYAYMLKAAESGQMQIVERVLDSDPEQKREDDYRLLMPVYQPGTEFNQGEQNKKLASIRGFASSLIYFEDLYHLLDEVAGQRKMFYRLTMSRQTELPETVLRDTRLVVNDRSADWLSQSEYLGDVVFNLAAWSQEPWWPGQSLFIKLFLLASVLVMLGSSSFVIVVAGQSIRIRTQVLRRTAQLEKAKRSAVVANRAKSDFLASMSHEIRTPLNGVVGMVDVLAHTKLQPHQYEMLDLIRVASFSLLELLNDILDFSKIEADKLLIDSHKMSIRKVVETTYDMLDPFAKSKGVDLSIYTDPQLPNIVMGDSVRVRQILVNLVSNAIKFTSQKKSGCVAVRALLDNLSKETATVTFEVIDNGIGIDKKTCETLFDPFTQADSSITRRFGGSGLGLAICQQLVVSMGGEISVESKLGQGSRFNVSLPFKATPEESVPLTDDALIQGVSCLVVGHSQLVLDLINYLEYAGAVVSWAEDVQAVEQQSHCLPEGRCVWIADVDSLQCEEALLAAVQASMKQDISLMALKRGSSKELHIINDHHVVVESNGLKQSRFINIVAQMAGRRPRLEDEIVSLDKRAALEDAKTDKAILVAEDNIVNQKVIQQQLALLGYGADVAQDGCEALKLWQQGDYALLLTDLHMPVMDGYQLTKEIRAQESGQAPLPIIAITANALVGAGKRCLAAGMNDYLTKPTKLEDLQAMLTKWLSDEHLNISSMPLIEERDETDNKSVVNIEVLRCLIGDDELLLKDLLEEYVRTTSDYLISLEKSFQDADFKEIKSISHTMRSAALSVGAQRLGELCLELEEAAKVKNKTSIDLCWSAFTQEVERVLAFIGRITVSRK